VNTQMNKIRSSEKGFMATHLINIGARIGLFEKLSEKKEVGFTIAINQGEIYEIETVKYEIKFELLWLVEDPQVCK